MNEISETTGFWNQALPIVYFIIFSLTPLLLSLYSFWQVFIIKKNYKHKIKIPIVINKLTDIKGQIYVLFNSSPKRNLSPLQLAEFNLHIQSILGILTQSSEFFNQNVKDQIENLKTADDSSEAWKTYEKITRILHTLHGINDDFVL